MNQNVFIIAISGASGSGKTSLAKELQKLLNPENTILLSQDSYYKDLSNLSINQRGNRNFDHPSSVDFDQIIYNIKSIKKGQSINIPSYDFTQHCRKNNTQIQSPKPTIIIEGTLVLNNKKLRELIDLGIFLDVKQDICLKRRIQRDTRERARTKKSVIKQYQSTVLPMFNKYVAPSKKYANHVYENEELKVIAMNLFNIINND